MEVRCERCKTEYEFDDTGVPEAGVAVQCTTCGHVFKVKKKAVLVTMPLQPGEVAAVGKVPAEPARPTPPAPAAPREWKVRQPSGNHFTFRELTTLQKWIVERKVGPDDEISLAGTEHWKRLGNIPALAPFFSVVQEAHSRPHNGPADASHDQPRTPGAGPTQVLSSAPNPPASVPSAPGAPASLGSGVFAINPAAASVQGRENVPTVIVDELGDNYAAEELKTGRGAWFLLLLTILLVGGGGYFGYMYYWQPQQQKEEAAARASARAAQAQLDRDRTAALEHSKAMEAARAKLAQETKSQETKSEDERLPAQAASPQDAPASALGPAGSDTTVAKKEAPTPRGGSRAEPPRNFDYYMAEGYRYLEKTPSLALQAYAKAAELRPDRAEPIGGRGLALFKMGDLTQAEASFREALKLNPSFGIAVIGLAKTYLVQGRKDKAAEYYGKYLEILPDGPEANGAKLALKRLRQE